jgi:hypothetical protein
VGGAPLNAANRSQDGFAIPDAKLTEYFLSDMPVRAREEPRPADLDTKQDAPRTVEPCLLKGAC